jgi:hypothetical protein
LVVFTRPVVQIVSDAAVFVHGDLVALHEPIESGLAVHHLIVGFERAAAESGVGL